MIKLRIYYCCDDFTDIRERFHYVVLLGTVLIGNLKQFNWNAGMQDLDIIISNQLLHPGFT